MVLIDLNRKEALGEVRDLQDGILYAQTPTQIKLGD